MKIKSQGMFTATFSQEEALDITDDLNQYERAKIILHRSTEDFLKIMNDELIKRGAFNSEPNPG